MTAIDKSDKNDSEKEEDAETMDGNKSENLKSENEDESVDDPLSPNLETGKSDEDSKPEIESDEPEMKDEKPCEVVKEEVGME